MWTSLGIWRRALQWSRTELETELASEKEEVKQQKQCFVIAPIGKEDSETRKRSDTLLDHIFVPALTPLGYEVIRADKISEPGSITIQVLDRILEADLVIADLTDHNPNVFYELAVRHALNKGVIHVICSGQSIPFDIADLRTINVVLDIPGAAKAVAELTAQAKQLETGEMGKTPISLANILNRSEKTKSDDGILLREMLDRLSELGSGLREVSNLQRTSTRSLERRIDFLTRRFRGPTDSELEREMSASRVKITAKDLEASLEGLPPSLTERFVKLTKEQRDFAAGAFEGSIHLQPDRRFRDLLEESIIMAERLNPKA